MKIIVLRRDVPTGEEFAALRRQFPRKILNFVRTDPPDYHEHYNDCVRLKADAVLLPENRPIPSLAMEKGFRHLTVSRGQLLELQTIDPVFAVVKTLKNAQAPKRTSRRCPTRVRGKK